jgi:hypothetical protein
LQVQRLQQRVEDALRERLSFESAFNRLSGQNLHALSAAALGANAVEELRSDILRLTERLTSIVAANAELLCEQCQLTSRLEVRKCPCVV